MMQHDQHMTLFSHTCSIPSWQ